MNEKEQLVLFIKEQLGKGVNVEAIKNMVRVQGWTDADIYQSITQAQAEMAVINNAPISPTVNPTSGQPAGSETPPTNQAASKSIISKIFVTIIILLLIGGIAYGSYYGYQKYFGFNMTVGEIVMKNITKLVNGEIKSVTVKSDSDVTLVPYADSSFSEVISGTSTIKTNFLMKYLSQGKELPDFSVDLNLSGNITADDNSPYKIGQFELSLSGSKVDNRIYLNFKKLPTLVTDMAPLALGFDIKPYLNQWYYIDVDQAKNMVSSGGTSAELNAEDIAIGQDYLTQLFDNGKLLLIKSVKADKLDDGTKVSNLEISFNYENLTNAVRLANDYMEKKYGDDASAADSVRLAKETNYDELDAMIKEWKDQNMQIQFTLIVESDGTIRGLNGINIINGLSSSGIKYAKTNYSNLISDYNKTTITAPSGAKSLEDLMMEIQTKMMKESSLPKR